ncbi:hypothetical protein HFP70_35895 [Streptomyces sp. ARC14]|uniref:hypothetical protein n=2 Tax=Streptomyces sp. ARC14 TaxID=2724152 RepID=UPI00385734D3
MAQARAEGDEPAVPGAAAAAVAGARAEPELSTPGAAAAAVSSAREDYEEPVGPGEAAAAVADARGLQMKSLPTGGHRVFEVSDDDFDQAQQTVAAALAPLFDREQGVIIARLRSPKTRKGTPFWKADSPADTRGGTDGLDVERIVGTDRWLEEIDAALSRVLTGVAYTAAQRTATAFGVAELPLQARGPLAVFVLDGVVAAEGIMRGFLSSLVTLLGQAQTVTTDVDDLVALVRSAFSDLGAQAAANVAEATRSRPSTEPAKWPQQRSAPASSAPGQPGETSAYGMPIAPSRAPRCRSASRTTWTVSSCGSPATSSPPPPDHQLPLPTALHRRRNRVMSWLIWTLWVVFFAVYEGTTLANKKKGDTLSENFRRLFRTKHSKAGRAVFTVGWLGFAGWFLLHILTETM